MRTAEIHHLAAALAIRRTPRPRREDRRPAPARRRAAGVGSLPVVGTLVNFLAALSDRGWTVEEEMPEKEAAPAAGTAWLRVGDVARLLG